MRTAIIIVNYNMPERTDALADHILDTVLVPYDLIVVDNGSDIMQASPYTKVRLARNVQTTNGWLMGLHYADALAALEGKGYFAYWFIITSAEFVPSGGLKADPLVPMVEFLLNNDEAVGVHPALTQDSTTMWEHMKCAGFDYMYMPRQVHMIDNIASLYRADWFDQIGRFDPRLIYGHGIDLETCWRARKNNRSLWIHEGSLIKKVTDIGYKMDRMRMSAEDRNRLASENMKAVLTARYGDAFWERLLHEYE